MSQGRTRLVNIVPKALLRSATAVNSRVLGCDCAKTSTFSISAWSSILKHAITVQLRTNNCRAAHHGVGLHQQLVVAGVGREDLQQLVPQAGAPHLHAQHALRFMWLCGCLYEARSSNKVPYWVVSNAAV